MASSSSIIVGGQDLYTWVQTLMKNEQAQIDATTNVTVSQLQTTQSTISSSLKEYTQLQNLLTTLQTNITALGTAFNASYNISSSSPAVATANAAGSISPGSHVVSVTQLAQAESIGSGIQNTSGSLGTTETLNFSVGSTNFQVNVNPGDALQDVANNIVAAAKLNSVPITASAQQVGSGQYQLIISSTQSGVANQFNIAEVVTSGTPLSVSTAVGSSTPGTVLTQAQNAQFVLDPQLTGTPPNQSVVAGTGMSFDVNSNTNIIEGMNIMLAGTGITTLSCTATNPVTNATTAIQNVYSAYNQIMSNISQAQATSASPDTTLFGIQTTLQSIMQSIAPQLATYGISLNTSPSPINITLADGVTPGTVTPTGLMNIDTNSADFQNLTTALTNNFAAVQAALIGPSSTSSSNLGGVFTQIANDLTTSTGSLWKALNDPTISQNGTNPNGAIPNAQKQLGNVNLQIQQAQANGTQLKNDLLVKYGKLALSLSTMQNTSALLNAQIQSMNQPSH